MVVMARMNSRSIKHFQCIGIAAFSFSMLCGNHLFAQNAVNDNRRRGEAPESVMQGNWRPVDQTVSDVDPRATSQRRLNHGNAMFNRNSTMYERDLPVDMTRMGRPGYDMRTGQYVPTKYQYRAPGVTALVMRPEYLVMKGRSGRRVKVERNGKPAADGLFADLASANMIYNLNIDLLNPIVLEPLNSRAENRVDTRVNCSVSLWNPVNMQPQSRTQIDKGLVEDYDGRIDGRVHGAVDNRVDGCVSPGARYNW